MGSHNINITQADLLKLKEDFYIDLAQKKMSEHQNDFEDLSHLNLQQIQTPKQSRNINESPNISSKLSKASITSKSEQSLVSDAKDTKSINRTKPTVTLMSGDENFTNSVLIESRLKLNQMDFHAKDDIQKFQDKLLKVDKQLDKILKEKQGKCKEYRQVKEDYTTVISKKKALQSTFMHIMDEYDVTLKKMDKY